MAHVFTPFCITDKIQSFPGGASFPFNDKYCGSAIWSHCSVEYSLSMLLNDT